MTNIRPDALTDALNGRRSRRAALRLLAGGALGTLGALALGSASEPAAAAVTALPALPTGWTNLAGTTTGLLFYRRGGSGATAGTGACGTFVDGRFARKATSANFAPNWTHVVGAGRSLLFYRDADGLGTTAYLDAAGTWVFPPDAVFTWVADQTPFRGTGSGRFFLFDESDLEDPLLIPKALTSDGYRLKARELFARLGGGWTHGAGAGADAYLLYRGGPGDARTGRIVKNTNERGEPQLFWVDRATYQLGIGWTHVVGTFNGGLLLYNRVTGRAQSGYLDAAGNWTRTAANLAVGAGWTHVVGAGARGVLFYKAATGKAVGGFLSAAGVWTKTTTYG